MKKNLLFIACITLLTLSSCYEDKKGCIDILSANYDPSSDAECEDCCVFPSLKIRINHIFKNGKLVFNDNLQNDIGSDFYLIDQKFYLSEVDVFNVATPLPFIKRSDYTFPSGVEKLYDKIGFVEKATPTIDINTIRTKLAPDSMSLMLGLPNKYNSLNKKLLVANSILLASKGLFDTTKVEYISYYLKFIGGASIKDTMSIYLYEDLQFQKSFIPITTAQGKPIEITLTADYNLLFEGIDFTKNKAIIEEKLKANLKSFIK